MLLSEVIRRLVLATKAEGRSPRTVGSYREKLGHLVRFLEDPHVEDVTIDDLRRFLAWQYEKGLSPFTIKSRVRALKRLWNFAQAEGITESNPAARIRTPRPMREAPKGIVWGDFLALLETTQGESVLDIRDRALILFLADSGCRVGGLCGLRVGDVDLEARRALVREKGEKSRLVFFQEPTARALAAWLDVRPGDRGPWVFSSFKGGCEGLTPSGVYNILAARGKRAGCKGPVNPHAFRHAFARAYLTQGGDLGTLSTLLGHSSVAVTAEYYAVFSVDELQRQHAKYSPLAGLEELGKNGD